ncbi:MAG: hypothetical protein ACOZQL_41815 [Myxococcota bacterium]
MRHTLLLTIAATVLGACSFGSQLDLYCAESKNCACSRDNFCCVKPDRVCSFGNEVAPCCSGTCVNGRCSNSLFSGGGGGTTGGGGGATGGGGGATGGGGAPDAGAWGVGVVLPASRYSGTAVDYAAGCPHPSVRTTNAASGAPTNGGCCLPSGDGGCRVEDGGFCAMPGAWTYGGRRSCCFSDAFTADELEFQCPFVERTDLTQSESFPGSGFLGCTDGGTGTMALGQCCTPSGQQCLFQGGFACSLTAQPQGKPCCFVMQVTPGLTRNSNDCRVTGHCVCDGGVTGCTPAPGAVCNAIVF